MNCTGITKQLPKYSIAILMMYVKIADMVDYIVGYKESLGVTLLYYKTHVICGLCAALFLRGEI
jgi:hypothetical protein